MRIALSSVATACLLVAATAVSVSASGIQADNTCAGEDNRRVFVQDGFLDDETREALLTGLSADRIDDGHYKHLRVPSSLSERVVAALGRFAPGRRGHAADTKDTVVLPFTEHVGDEPEHQDHHRDGMHRGQMAEGHVGVVYLEGDGDFVLANTATGMEERVAIAPGKMISWSNADFRHRVEHGSMPRRLLGPMVLDTASGSLLGVGGYETSYTGYECVDPDPAPASSSVGDVDNCVYIFCSGYDFMTYDSTTLACSCYSTCSLFQADSNVNFYSTGATPPDLVLATTSPSSSPSISPSASPSRNPSTSPSTSPSKSPSPPSIPPSRSPSTSPSASPSSSPSTSPSASPSSSPSTSPSTSAPSSALSTDSISISAASRDGRSTVQGGRFYTLLVTLSLPAADTLDRRELLMKTSTDRHALNSITYALLVDVPGTGNVTYKPASLKKPAVEAGGDLLWSKVAILLYASKPSKRTFKVTFKVNKGAASPLTFVASVWKDDVQLQTATPVVVTVTSKSG